MVLDGLFDAHNGLVMMLECYNLSDRSSYATYGHETGGFSADAFAYASRAEISTYVYGVHNGLDADHFL